MTLKKDVQFIGPKKGYQQSINHVYCTAFGLKIWGFCYSLWLKVSYGCFGVDIMIFRYTIARLLKECSLFSVKLHACQFFTAFIMTVLKIVKDFLVYLKR